jgi:hypothetical protein
MQSRFSAGLQNRVKRKNRMRYRRKPLMLFDESSNKYNILTTQDLRVTRKNVRREFGTTVQLGRNPFHAVSRQSLACLLASQFWFQSSQQPAKSAFSEAKEKKLEQPIGGTVDVIGMR